VNTTKYTPGPWNRGIGQNIYQGERWDPHGNQRLIASCHPSTRTQEDWEQTWANAKFIAAAPDLLAALIECADYLAEFFEEGREHRVIKLADQAIAKATGEQP
jgi:hypothetical protein